jgi:hypothetical protein
MPCEFQFWTSDEDGWMYWHLVDARGNIIATGHQRYRDEAAAKGDCQKVMDCLDARATVGFEPISDPNA